jgi:hypothetical protein
MAGSRTRRVSCASRGGPGPAKEREAAGGWRCGGGGAWCRTPGCRERELRPTSPTSSPAARFHGCLAGGDDPLARPLTLGAVAHQGTLFHLQLDAQVVLRRKEGPQVGGEAVVCPVVRLVLPNLQGRKMPAKLLDPELCEGRFHLPRRVEEDAQVHGALLAMEHRGEGVDTHVQDKGALADHALDQATNLGPVATVISPDEAPTLLLRDRSREVRKELGVAGTPVHVHQETGGEGVAKGRRERPGQVAGQPQRSRVPPPVALQLLSGAGKEMGPPLGHQVASVFAGHQGANGSGGVGPWGIGSAGKGVSGCPHNRSEDSRKRCALGETAGQLPVHRPQPAPARAGARGGQKAAGQRPLVQNHLQGPPPGRQGRVGAGEPVGQECLPHVAGGGVGPGAAFQRPEAQGPKVSGGGHGGPLAVLDHGVQEIGQVARGKPVQGRGVPVGTIHEMVHQAADHPRDGRHHPQVGLRALLGVQDPDLHRAPPKPGDGAPGVHPLVPEDAARIQGSQVAVQGLQDPLLVLSAAHRRLRDDTPGHRGHSAAVLPVGRHAGVQGTRGTSLQEGGRRGQSRKEGEHDPDGGMEEGQLPVALEGEVQVGGLEVRPPVAPARKDPVEGPVDLGVFVGPEAALPLRVHPGVGPARQETASHRDQELVGLRHRGLERFGQPLELPGGPIRLHLQHVQGQLVGPGDPVQFHFGGGLAGHGLHEAVRHRAHVQALGVHDDVLDLDPVALEEPQGRLGRLVAGLGVGTGSRRIGHRGDVLPRSSSRRRK